MEFEIEKFETLIILRETLMMINRIDIQDNKTIKMLTTYNPYKYLKLLEYDSIK